MSEIDAGALRAWVEDVTAQPVTRIERQGARETGGRPAWFVDTGAAPSPHRYYIRAERMQGQVYAHEYTLEREYELLRVLHREGITVPAVHAYLREPAAILMDCAPGENDFALIAEPARRQAIGRHFVEILARWHAIDAAKFAAIGMRAPRGAEDYVLADLGVWERGYAQLIGEPEPLVTFACRWLRRNFPPPPARPVLVQGDTGPGQFLFEGDRVTAVIDWEFAFLGDPMQDLARIRTRDFWYPTHGLIDWFRHYEAITGVPIDLPKLRYYSVIAMLTTPLALAPVVQTIDPRNDHAEWISQLAAHKRTTAETLAEAAGIALEPYAAPAGVPSRYAPLYDVLEYNLREEQLPAVGDAYLRHRLAMSLRLLAHLRNVERIGAAVEDEELADLGAVLGARPRDRVEGMRALDALVQRAPPARDAELIRYFHRHALREEALLRGGLGRAENARMTPLDGLG